MVGERALLVRHQDPARSATPQDADRAGGARARSVRSLLIAGVAAGVTVAYALPGGAYDLVTRQEYGIVLWGVLGAGWVLGLLPRSRPSGLTLAFIALLIGYAAWIALSLNWTDSAERTTTELARVVHYIGLVGLIVSILDRSSWRPAAIGIGFGALVVCALAVASRLVPTAFPSDALFQTTSRLNYPFGYWNAVGAWGAMSATVTLAWSAHDRVVWRRALALGLVPLALAVTYLSLSRAAAAGTVLGGLFALCVSRHRMTMVIHMFASACGGTIVILAIRGAGAIVHGTGTAGAGRVFGAMAIAGTIGAVTGVVTAQAGIDRWRAPRGYVRGAVILLALVVTLLAAGLGPKLVNRAWRQFRHPAVVTTTDPASRLTQLSGTRYGVWSSALRAFSRRPLTGTGAGTFEFWWNRDGTTSEAVRNAHSFELENLAELGVPGLALQLAVFASGLAILISARRKSRRGVTVGASAAMLAAFVVYLMQASVDWLWQLTAVTALALGGVAVVATRLADAALVVRWPLRAAVTACAAGAVAVQLPGLLSTAEITRSQQAERNGDAAHALAWANAAVSAQPWSASAYEQRGLVLESAGRFDAAAGDLSRAVAREHDNFRHWLILARVEAERGAFAAATQDLRRAKTLRPKALVFLYAPYFRGARSGG
jgi:hypothetical protein